jgi:hypothetical protein
MRAHGKGGDHVTSLNYAYTGALKSRVHIAEEVIYQTLALCGVGIHGTTEYRPSQERLQQALCPRCARLARARGEDPFAIGVRDDPD